MADTTRSCVWVDAAGRTRQTILRGNASLATVEADLLALTNADTQRSWEGPTVLNPSPAPTNATYPNVADYAVLVYTDGTDLVYVTLVAPQASVFLPDGETVDPVAIATLTGHVIGTITTGSGAAVTGFVGGFRRRSGKEYQ